MRGNWKLPVYSFVLGESGFFLLTETSLMVFSFFLCLFGEAALSVVLFTSLLSELCIPLAAVAGVSPVQKRGGKGKLSLGCHCCHCRSQAGGRAVQWLGSLAGGGRREWYNLSDSLMKNYLQQDASIQKLASLTLFPVYRRSKGSVPSGLWFVLCVLVPLLQLPAGVTLVQYRAACKSSQLM